MLREMRAKKNTKKEKGIEENIYTYVFVTNRPRFCCYILNDWQQPLYFIVFHFYFPLS